MKPSDLSEEAGRQEWAAELLGEIASIEKAIEGIGQDSASLQDAEQRLHVIQHDSEQILSQLLPVIRKGPAVPRHRSWKRKP